MPTKRSVKKNRPVSRKNKSMRSKNRPVRSKKNKSSQNNKSTENNKSNPNNKSSENNKSNENNKPKPKKNKNKKSKKGKRPLNQYFKLMLEAKKAGKDSFEYKGKTYVGKKHETLGMVYKKSKSN